MRFAFSRTPCSFSADKPRHHEAGIVSTHQTHFRPRAEAPSARSPHGEALDKQRLLVVFPELRNNPRALETAYQSLGLSPRPGTEEGDAETVFEMSLPTGREPSR